VRNHVLGVALLAVLAAQNKYWNTGRVLKDPFRIDGVHVVGDYALFQWYGGEADLVRYIGSKSIAHQLCSGWPAHYAPC
jgi:hypothetical protein